MGIVWRQAGSRLAVAAGVAVAFCALPGAALGATVTLTNGDLSIVDAAGDANDLTVELTAPDTLTISDIGPNPPTAGAGCVAGAPLSVMCTKPGGPFAAGDTYTASLGGGADLLFVNTNVVLPGTVEGEAGSDFVTGGDGPEDLRGGDGDDSLDGRGGGGTVQGGAGDDFLIGGQGTETIEGGDGDDNLDGLGGGDALQGGAGQDDLSSGDGNNALDGGPGDDSLTARGTGADDLRGGSGFDPAAESVSVTLDDVANDGHAGEGKNFHTDIEGAAAETDANDSSVLGGNGAPNILQGGDGSDDVTPGAGADTVFTASGGDIVRTADGFPDLIACGPGADSVTADQFDTLNDCENVTIQQLDSAFAGAPPAPITQVVQAAAQDGTAPAFSAFTVPSRLTRRQLRRGVRVSFAADEAASAEVELTGRLRRGTIARAGDLVLAERGLRSGTGRRTVTVKLGRAALRSLPRRGRFRIRLQVTLIDAAGNRRARTRTITVR